MVASRQVEIPFYRAFARQCGQGFGALAQVVGRTTCLFLRINNVPATKRVGAHLLQFATPEIAEVVSCRENLETAAESVGRQTLRKQFGSGGRKRTASRVIPIKSAKQTSRSRRDIFANIPQ